MLTMTATFYPLPDPVALPLAGRERERAALRAALGAALAGRGSLVLIGGEAGIGKTALAEGLAAEALGQGALALIGRCYDLTETSPYGPWRELFARAPSAARGAALPPELRSRAAPAGAASAGRTALF